MDKARKPTVEVSRYCLRGIGVGLESVYSISLTRRIAGFLFIGKVMGTNITNPIKIYFNSSRIKVTNVRKNP